MRHSPPPLDESTGAKIDRGRLRSFLVVVALGLVLRLIALDGAAIEHFDEGVYASNLLFDESEGAQYPGRSLYAPPLFPWLVEWAMVFLGGGNAGTFTVGVAMGTALIAAIAWVGHRWFGWYGGITAAALAAVSDPFVIFGSACLTDVSLALWWVLAMGLMREAVARDSRPWGVAAGVAVALAWWTKYNGWLPLALSLAAIMAWGMTSRIGVAAMKRALATWGVAAATAFVLWSPVWWGLQDHGGYSAVAANHARYYHGPAGWWAAVVRQCGNLQALETTLGRFSLWTILAIPAAAMLATVALNRMARQRSRDGSSAEAMSSESRIGKIRAATAAAGIVAAGALLFVMNAGGCGLAVALFAVAGVIGLRRDLLPRKQSLDNGGEALAAWFATVWFVGMLALTPMYREYPRLTLPWLAGAFVCGGAFSGRAIGSWIARIGAAIDRPARSEVAFQLLFVGVMSAGGLLALRFGGEVHRETFPSLDRTGLKKVSLAIDDAVRAAAAAQSRSGSQDAVVYVYAEPAVLFHLRVANGVIGQPISSLRFAEPGEPRSPAPTFFVFGPHARRTPAFVEQWNQLADRFEPVAEWEWQPSLVVLLDHYEPQAVRTAAEPIAEKIELYRLR